MNNVSIQTSDARDQAIEILDSCVFHATQLRQCLEEEHDALAAQDIEALMSAIEDKGVCVRELQAFEAKRAALCSASGFPDGPTQMADFSAWCDDDALIERSWDELLGIAADCSSLNLANGAFISMRKQHLDAGIAVLRGIDPASPTYDRHGGARDGLGNRSIAEA